MATIPKLLENLCAVSPALAARVALFLFTHPAPPSLSTKAERRLAKRAQAKLAEAEREDLRVNSYRIATYRFTPKGPASKGTILLVHGWTSNAAFMTAPVDDLLNRGFEVVAFDMPAHGNSSGRRAMLMDCALAMVAVSNQFGPVCQVIAHSFGGPVTTLALASGLSSGLTDSTKLLFIASPNRTADVTEQFSRALGLNKEAQELFETEVAGPFGVSVHDLDGNRVLAGCPNTLTIIHSRDDQEVGFDAAEKYALIGERVDVRPLEGLGHRRILHAQPSLNAMLEAVVC